MLLKVSLPPPFKIQPVHGCVSELVWAMRCAAGRLSADTSTRRTPGGAASSLTTTPRRRCERKSRAISVSSIYVSTLSFVADSWRER
jgi:hypothetical protein